VDKLYERNLCVAYGNPLVLPAGISTLCFDIGMPQEALIKKLIVKQASGTATAFTVAFYNRKICATVETLSSTGSVTAGDSSAVTDELAEVIEPTTQSTPGLALKVVSANDGYDFCNREGSFTCPVRKGYLQISVPVALSGASEWEVSIAMVLRDAG
jgi:hypothetical protein